jgi:hypothetical protein
MKRYECAKWHLAAVVLVLAATTSVWAQIPASGDYNNPGQQTYHDMDTGIPGWQIGTRDNPVDVILDPNAGPWIKNLVGPDGGPVPADETCGQITGAPCSYTLTEWIHIAGRGSWTDFHEEVLTPGWNISGFMSRADNEPISGLTNMLMDTDGFTHGGAVWWFFDPLPPSTVLKFQKTLTWVGDPNTPGNLFNGIIQVAQYPTPEPASAALVALGATMLVLRRKLWRS